MVEGEGEGEGALLSAVLGGTDCVSFMYVVEQHKKAASSGEEP